MKAVATYMEVEVTVSTDNCDEMFDKCYRNYVTPE